MSLDTYYQKRNFEETPEPRGEKKAELGYGYVIQKHHARRLHYDFRLELDGVLKSWAVPKGPSLNPKEKRLAVETEDHPVDYAHFEGVIPKPGYGAGTVMLWDAGEWQAEGDANKALANGKLSFVLQGERLKGKWTLIKMKGGKSTGKEWLLLKDDDEYADGGLDPTEAFKKSVLTDRSMEAIAQGEAPTRSPAAQRPSKSLKSSSSRTKKRSEKEISAKSAKKADKKPKQESAQRNKSLKKKSQEVEQTLDGLQSTVSSPKKPAGKRRKASGASNQGSEMAAALAKLRGAKKRRFLNELKPQLATLYKTVPDGEQWLHEIKYDGYRLLAMNNNTPRLLTRNGKDWTAKFPSIAAALETLPQAILDGEVVCLTEQGISSFEGLQNALRIEQSEDLVFYVFDLPYLQGYDLTEAPLLERKKLLEKLVEQLGQKNIRYSEHILSDGPVVYEHACAHRLEGIISKQADSHYQSARTKTWRKIKCAHRQEFVIVGFTAPGGSRKGFGALLLGYYEAGALRYAGRVGTGFNASQLQRISQKLNRLVQKTTPIDGPVQEPEATWVKPTLVAEVEFTEWTSSNRLRHPAFLGLREDKPAREIGREVAQDGAAPTSGNSTQGDGASRAGRKKTRGRSGASRIAGVSLSNPDKVLYDQAQITKQDLAEYYERVAEFMLPYVQRRPLTLVRCPQGHAHHCFFQKHLTDALSDSVKPIAIDEKKGTLNYAYVEDARGLVELVQMGTLEIHAWGSRVDQVEKPDTLVFDLDPGEGVPWSQMQQGALDVYHYLINLGLSSFLRTSGGKGLHVVVPISRRHSWDQVKAFAKALAVRITQDQPESYVATATKAKRKNKIFIDYLRNGRGATSICCYSTRGRDFAPVATPLRWDELGSLPSSQKYRLDNIEDRLESISEDPWEDFFSTKQSITQKMRKTLGMRDT